MSNKQQSRLHSMQDCNTENRQFREMIIFNRLINCQITETTQNSILTANISKQIKEVCTSIVWADFSVNNFPVRKTKNISKISTQYKLVWTKNFYIICVRILKAMNCYMREEIRYALVVLSMSAFRSLRIVEINTM